MKMPKKLKQKWLKALRSGEYGQTKNVLCDGKGNFCCLGVLEHIALKGEVEITPEGKYDEFPNDQFWRYAGIKKGNLSSDWPNFDLAYHLAEANDGGESFEELAELIEEAVETY